jgi:hypothetical protein
MSDTTTAPTDAAALPQRLLYSTQSLAAAISKSPQYVRDDIRDGHLIGRRENERSSYLIAPAEAERYARWLAAGRPKSEDAVG